MENGNSFFGNNFMRNFLAFSWSYFCFFYFTLFALYPIPQQNQNAVHIILGFLIGIPILGFYFATTQGSQEKNKMLAESQPAPTASLTTSTTTAVTEKKADDGDPK